MPDIITSADIASHEYMHGKWDALQTFHYFDNESNDEKDKFVHFLEETGMLSVFAKELAEICNSPEK